MTQFDLYVGANGAGYLLDIQSDWLDGASSRVVVPLLQDAGLPPPVKRLNPVYEILGARHVMATQLLAAVPSSHLRGGVGTLKQEADAIKAALDILFHGY